MLTGLYRQPLSLLGTERHRSAQWCSIPFVRLRTQLLMPYILMCFMCRASVERNLTYNHAIERPNGYDAGRDEIVGNATRSEGTSALGYSFTATASIVSDLLQGKSSSVTCIFADERVAGSQGINHDIAIDGDVAVLTVQIVESGLPISSATSNIVSALPISESAALQAVQSSAVAGGLPSAAGSGSLKM